MLHLPPQNHRMYYPNNMHITLRNTILVGAVFVMSHQIGFAQKKDASAKKIEITPAQQLEAEGHFTDGMKYFMMEDYDKAIAPLEKALSITPKNSGVLYALGKVYRKLEAEDKAIGYVQKAIELDPNNASYNELLADLYVKNKQFSDAQTVYQKLVNLFPNNPEYYLQQGALYIFDNRLDDAVKAFDRAEKVLGISEELSRQKQAVLLKIGKVEDAIKEGEKLIASDPEEIDYIIDQAELLIANKRNDQAIPYLEKILKMNPGNAQAHVMLAQLYQEKGDMDKCNKELELAFADPNLDVNAKARILMSYVSMMKDEKSKQMAFNLVKSLIVANPKDPKSHAIYGDLLFQKGEVAEARNEYVKAAHLDPSVNEVWGRIIQLDFDLNQIDSAIVHSEEAIEVFPNQSIFWYLNGSAHYRKRNNEKAIEALEEAKRLAPEGYELAQHIFAQLGDTYNSIGKHEKSDEAYEAALKEEPDNDHVLNNYSYFLSLRKVKLEKAAQMANRLVERHPNNGTYLDTYAWVLYEMKDFAKAKIYLEKAVENNLNKSGTIVEHYGDVLFQLGEVAKAVEQWKKAKAIGGTSHNLDQKILQQKLIE